MAYFFSEYKIMITSRIVFFHMFWPSGPRFSRFDDALDIFLVNIQRKSKKELKHENDVEKQALQINPNFYFLIYFSIKARR